MTFKAKIECDAAGCFTEMDLKSGHPSDAEMELLDQSKGWLDADGDHYCPAHAMQAANELNIEYAPKN